MNRAIAIFVCLFAVGLLPGGVRAQQTFVQVAQSSGTIQEIVIEGANRVEPATVKSYLLVQEGDGFDRDRIDQSLKSLFGTGLFADVSMHRQGDTLVVSVVENPIINRIAFEGNDRIDNEVLEAEVSLRPRVIFTRTKVQNDVQRILTLYRRQGRFAATVEPKVIQLPQNRVDLVFEISEGEPTEIQNIRFVGNRAFDDGDLREVIQTKESRWYRFLSSDDVYDPDRLTLDRELLRQFYLSEGYADFRVTSAVAELTPDRRDFFITFTVDEGARYQFGELDLDVRLKDLDPESMREMIEAESGDWYSSEEVEDTVDRLTEEVGVRGYAFVDVRPRINRDRENRKIDVTFEINEGPRVFVERIEIKGNVRTLDRVIRREFRLVEGDAFNSAQLRRSRQRIQDLDFFRTVSVERLPGSAPDKTVIEVNVEEKSTGSLTVGAGYSTDNGPLGDIGLRERNFLGRGQDLSVNARIAQRRSEAQLSFTEPYFLGREVAAGFDVFRVTQDNQEASSYDSKRFGGALRTGYPITEYLRQNWRYTLEQQEVDNVDDDASRFIRAEEGKEWLSEISHSLTYDVRDSRLQPTTGYLLGMTNDFAGVGGTTNYVRNQVRAVHYTPITDDVVFSVGGRAGVITGIGEDVSLLDRFFVGGSDLRGFASGGIGPRDQNTGDALGGEWMYTGTVEVLFPMWGVPDELGLRARTFSDFGTLGGISPTASDIQDEASLRVSAGVGFTWTSPFGPIGVDFAFPIQKEEFDDTENIRLNFGTRF